MSAQGRIRVGDPAPDFTCNAVVDGRIKEISLSAYTQANHWLLLLFFPRAWSYICPTEIRAFSARVEEFLYSRSYAVAFASTDSEVCLRAWNATGELEGGLGGVHVPLISDSAHKLSRAYGVLVEEEGVAERAMFVIDPKGKVRAVAVSDVDVGRSVDEAQRVMDALAFKDEFGEGCPADWKKGNKGIDVAGKSKVEGQVEVRKSWVDWARPKLARTWSTASHASSRSLSGIMESSRMNGSGDNLLVASMHSDGDRTTPRSGGISATRSPARSISLSSQPVVPSSDGHSPAFSPTSHGPGGMEGQMTQAMMQQQFDNMQAALANQKLTQDIGVAN